MNTTTTPAPMTGSQYCTCSRSFVRTAPDGLRFCGLCQLRKP